MSSYGEIHYFDTTWVKLGYTADNITNWVSSAIFSAELNGTWELKVVMCKKNNPYFTKVKVMGILQCDVGYGESKQYMRIYDIQWETEQCTITAFPIFWDIGLISSVNTYNITRETPIQTSLKVVDFDTSLYRYSDVFNGFKVNFGDEGSQDSGWRAKEYTASYEKCNRLEVITGSGGLCDLWNCKATYDNWTIKFFQKHDQRMTHGYEKFEYGINLEGCTRKVCIDNYYNYVRAYAYNNRTWTYYQDITAPITVSGIVTYDDMKLVDDASDDDKAGKTDVKVYNTTTALEKAMYNRLVSEFNNGTYGTLPVEYDIDTVSFMGDSRYDRFNWYNRNTTRNIEKLQLGNPVSVYDKDFGEFSACVSAVTYDVLLQDTTSIKLTNFVNRLIYDAIYTDNYRNSLVADKRNLSGMRLANTIRSTNQFASKKTYWDLNSGKAAFNEVTSSTGQTTTIEAGGVNLQFKGGILVGSGIA